MKNFINSSYKYITATAVFTSLQSYLLLIRYNKGQENLQKIRDENKILLNILNSYSESDKDGVLKQIKNNSSILYENQKILNDNLEKLNNIQNIKHNNEASKCISECMNAFNKCNNSIKDGIYNNIQNNFFWDNNWFKELYDNWYNFLSNLNTQELGAFSHLLACFFILWCLFSIIIIVYSDFLIKYFNIEVKYPKIGKFIKYRRLFQHYYLFINFMFIILTLFALLYVNFLVLFI